MGEQVHRNKNILEASEIQQKSGINFSMESNVQTTVVSMQASPLFKTIPKGRKDAHFTSTINNNAQVKQNSYVVQPKEVQAAKHESRRTIEEEQKSAHSKKQQHNRMKSHTNKEGNFQYNIRTQLPQYEYSKKYNNNNSENNNFSRKSQTRMGNGRSNNNNSNSNNENYNRTKKNANSSHASLPILNLSLTLQRGCSFLVIRTYVGQLNLASSQTVLLQRAMGDLEVNSWFPSIEE